MKQNLIEKTIKTNFVQKYWIWLLVTSLILSCSKPDEPGVETGSHPPRMFEGLPVKVFRSLLPEHAVKFDYDRCYITFDWSLGKWYSFSNWDRAVTEVSLFDWGRYNPKTNLSTKVPYPSEDFRIEIKNRRIKDLIERYKVRHLVFLTNFDKYGNYPTTYTVHFYVDLKRADGFEKAAKKEVHLYGLRELERPAIASDAKTK